LTFLAGDRKETYRDIYRLFGQKKYDEALKRVEKAMKELGASGELKKLKYNILMNLKKYDEALAFVDAEIKASGETQELAGSRFKVLFRMDKPREALKAAMRKYELAKPKSPWDCMDIMHVHLRLGNKQESLDWLEEAVSRGFISYRILAGKKYGLLTKEKRFYQIIETIKIAVGLGYPAKKIKVKLLSGENFTLAGQRGKVVLIDFWATWCEPCLKEMPFLNELYKEFKDKGFEILAVSLDSNEKKLKEYIEKNKLEWKFVYTGKVWKDDVTARYGVNSLPSHWLIDKRGRLRSFDLKGKELKRTISLLLAER
jgi:thiol-disulfide isomerase/thioredoxin